jgi:hypothetical protein
VNALVTFAVTFGATVTATAATAGAEWARRASARSAKSVRHIEGESDSDPGLLDIARDNREALQHAGLYPPKATDGGRERGQDE